MPMEAQSRLSDCTLVIMAKAARPGAVKTRLRYVKGPERNFPARCFFFLREDVSQVLAHPIKGISGPKHSLTLAMRTETNRREPMRADAVSAVVSVAYNEAFRTLPSRWAQIDFFHDVFGHAENGVKTLDSSLISDGLCLDSPD
jgi:hypothetical protein